MVRAQGAFEARLEQLSHGNDGTIRPTKVLPDSGRAYSAALSCLQRGEVRQTTSPNFGTVSSFFPKPRRVARQSTSFFHFASQFTSLDG
jgi:hypothetical protein